MLRARKDLGRALLLRHAPSHRKIGCLVTPALCDRQTSLPAQRRAQGGQGKLTAHVPIDSCPGWLVTPKKSQRARATALVAAAAIAALQIELSRRAPPTLLAGAGSSPAHADDHLLIAASAPRRGLQHLAFALRAALRAVTLSLVWTPVTAAGAVAMSVAAIARSIGAVRAAAATEEWWWRLVLHAVESSGAAWVKLGQWASTRRDLFPKPFCDRFSQLHSSARPHGRRATLAALNAAYGAGLWEERLNLNYDKPIGCGAVAQVYRGELLEAPGMPTKAVAVKVIHPFVKRGIELDLALMRAVASVAESLPRLSWLSLRESVEEFALLMERQLDLRVEAKNLERFRRNFANREGVVFPEPLSGWSSEHVLVETYEPGEPMTRYVDDEGGDPAFRKRLARIGLSAFLDMVFIDNFVHGDLHPGNMLVQLPSTNNSNNNNSNSNSSSSNSSSNSSSSHGLRLALLDVGIVCELGPRDRRNFVDLFYAIVKGDGREAGRLMIERARDHRCDDPEAFMTAIAAIVDQARSSHLRLRQVHVAELLGRVLALCCRHRVKLESNFASVVIAIAVLEGVGRSLDPDIDILRAAGPVLLKAYWQTRGAAATAAAEE